MNNLGQRASSEALGGTQVEALVQTPSDSARVDPPSGMSYKILLVLIAILWLVVIAVSWVGAEDTADADQSATAESAAPSSQSSSDDEYNFNWLDPEKKIYVLQNRRYVKAHRALLSLLVGPGLSNPYRNVFNVDPRIAYYFSEAWGIEAFYDIAFNTPNGTIQALAQATSTTLGVVHEVRAVGGGEVHWVPWYAKINVFNRILYFDWYFGAGAGIVNWYAFGTGTQANAGSVIGSLSRPAGLASTGQQFHLNDNLTVRLDFTGAFFTAPIIGVQGDTAWFSNYNFEIGLGIRL